MRVCRRRSNAGGEEGPVNEEDVNIDGEGELPPAAEEEEDGEGFDRAEVEEERENGDEEVQKPQLPEGFYEIEAIRKKRVKKGQAQYLIKWRGWPESTNTWEPYDNLLACADDVDAFEQRMQSGKHRSSQKGKRGSQSSTSQSKKRRSSATSVRKNLFQESASIPYQDEEGLDNGPHTNVEEINVSEAAENNVSIGFPPRVEGEQLNERNVNHSEITNDVNLGVLGVDKQAFGASEVNGHAKDGEGLASQSVPIRRRKSVSTMRFLKDETDSMVNSMPENSRVTRSRVQAAQQHQKNSVDNPDDNNDATIIKIIKAVNFEASGADNEVLVTFKALSSDQKEVMVDNKFLKVNNPLMLINFYEGHLKYNADKGAQI